MRLLFVFAVLALSQACMPRVLYPVSMGFHQPINPADEQVNRKVTVYANDSRVQSTVIGFLGRSKNITLVDPSMLPPAQDPNTFIANAKAAGIERVVFAEASIQESEQSGSSAAVNAYWGAAHSYRGTVYGLSV